MHYDGFIIFIDNRFRCRLYYKYIEIVVFKQIRQYVYNSNFTEISQVITLYG
jgi:hypothetical protein